jgi:hypothetical protein
MATGVAFDVDASASNASRARFVNSLLEKTHGNGCVLVCLKFLGKFIR